MASKDGNKLELVFNTNEGTKVTHNYNYVDYSAETADVQAVVTAIIANGVIFEKVPTSISSAAMVKTNVVKLNLS